MDLRIQRKRLEFELIAVGGCGLLVEVEQALRTGHCYECAYTCTGHKFLRKPRAAHLKDAHADLLSAVMTSQWITASPYFAQKQHRKDMRRAIHFIHAQARHLAELELWRRHIARVLNVAHLFCLSCSPEMGHRFGRRRTARQICMAGILPWVIDSPRRPSVFRIIPGGPQETGLPVSEAGHSAWSS